MGYIKNIDRFQSKDNLGGITELLVIRTADVISIPDPINGAVFGEAVLQAGASFAKWNVILESPQVNSASRSSNAGRYRSNTIEFSIPKDRADLQNMFEQAEDDEFIVLYKYPGGTWKLFGLLETPVQFEYSHDSGGKLADRNQYIGRFYYEGPDNRYFYNAEIPEPAPGAAPVIVRVNGVVVAAGQPGDIIDFDTDFEFDFEIVGT